MNFKQLDIYTKSEGMQILASYLEEIGINGFVMHDSADFEEFINNKNSNWDYIDDELMKLKESPSYITAYVPDDSQGADMIIAVKGILGELDGGDLFGEIRIEIDCVREEDWENNWKQYYKPFKIGKRFIIKPTWENIDTSDNSKLILEIDPASAFGTGQHGTTRLCMELLEEVITENAECKKMLDLGCGSGILSIAGLLLGVKSVSAVDIFENAVNITERNIEQNGFDSSRYHVYCGNVVEDIALRDKIGNGYDVITANIVADVIIPMCGFIGKLLGEKGNVILSGIISERLPEVTEAAEKGGFVINAVRESDGWNAVLMNIA